MARPDFRFAALVVLLMAVATGWVAWTHHLPVRDPDGVAGPSWVQIPLIIVLAIASDVVPRTVYRSWRTPRAIGATAASLLRERWGRGYLRFALAAFAVTYVCNSAFRNLKSYVPFVNGHTWDQPLDALDRALWLGHDPATVLHQLLGTGWAAHFLSFVYVSWLVLVPFTMAVALVWTHRTAVAAWYFTALTLDWALGVATYFLVPSLGPIYATPERFDALPQTYVATIQESMIDGRAAMLADPWSTGAVQPIAAFASLHVGIVVTMVIFARLLGLARWIRVTGWVYLGLTTLATVYLGWHYSVDAVGGAAIGALAVWLAALGTGNHVAGIPRLQPEPVPATRPAPAPVPQPAAIARRTSSA